jgi:hypothetical protein
VHRNPSLHPRQHALAPSGYDPKSVSTSESIAMSQFE